MADRKNDIARSVTLALVVRVLLTVSLLLTLSLMMTACGGGSDSEPASTDIAAVDVGCPSGTLATPSGCAAVVCGADLCAAGELYRCADDGLSISEPAACPGGLLCEGLHACRQRCSDDRHCVAGRVCVDGACAEALTDGEPCTADAACLSGRCLRESDGAKGVCAASDEQRCLAVAADGAPVFAENDSRTCGEGGWRICVAGAWSPAVPCAEARCTDGVYTAPDTCVDGEGCVAAVPVPCPGGFACEDGETCGTACETDAGCAFGGRCVDSACVTGAGCVVGAAYCTGADVMRCEDGEVFERVATCAQSQSCVGGACRDRLCEPNATRCEAGGVSACAADGMSWIAATPCGEGLRCESGRCVAQGCEPGSRACVGDTIIACDPTGTGMAPVETCSDDTSCDAGACVPQVCEPGVVACEGNWVALCDERGRGLASVYDCGALVCVDGRCGDLVCAPGQTRCDGDAVAACADDGSSWGDPNPCEAGAYCLDGACVPQDCAPGSLVCLDGDLLRCDERGAEYVFDEACGDERFCAGGHCLDRVCEPDETVCRGADVLRCAADGSGWRPDTSCEPGQVCADGVCQETTCTPRATGCEGDTVVLCADDGGSWNDLFDCGELVCLDGECVAPLCEPERVYCQGDALILCSPDGMSWSEPAPCADGFYCADGVCVPRTCTPETLTCLGAELLRCAPDGSGWVHEERCGEDAFCADGACSPRICDDAEEGCDGDAVVTCNADGSGWELVETCPDGEACLDAACVAIVCTPLERVCDGRRVLACTTNGTGWTQVERCEVGFECLDGACVERYLVPDEDFETGDLTRFPWETGGSTLWGVVAVEGRDGSYAARTNAAQAAGTTSSLTITLSVRDSAPISFWLKTETEDGHYLLTFLIDGVEKAVYSGVSDWTWVEHPVGVGVHSFEWRYSRDGFVSTEHPMRNAVWLDDIRFPAFNSAPSVPAGDGPFDNAVVSSLQPTIRWSSEDPDTGDSIIYEFQMDTTLAFTSPISTGESTANEYTPDTELVDGATYWWRVRSKDDYDDQWGRWSAPRSFTLRSTVPRIAWLQRSGDQLGSGAVMTLVEDGDGFENAANIVVVTPYDSGDGGNFVTVREAYDTSEDAVYLTHAPTVGYEYNHWEWTSDIAYGYDGGFRFQHVPVGGGVPVESAELCLMQCYNCYGYDELSESTAYVRVTADAVGDAALWPEEGTTLSGYTATTASVDWTISGLYESGECIVSPDVTDIVQEVVTRQDWASGNAMRFLLEDTHGDGVYSSTQHWERLFYSSGNELRVRFPALGTLTSPPIHFADISGAVRWDKAQWAGDGDIVVQVLDEDGALISPLDLPGNDSGFTTQTIPLWGLDPAAYPVLRLRATLTRAGDDGVARLDEWSVSWGEALRWDFDNDGDREGWSFGPQTPATTVSVSGGHLRVESDGDDPSLKLLGLNLPASGFSTMEVTLRSGNTDQFDVVALSWANGEGGFGAHLRQSEEVFLLDTRTITFDLTSPPAEGSAELGLWSGTILNLRVDPVASWQDGSGWVELDSLVLY